MNKHKFLISVLLTAIVFCWAAGLAAAQKNPVLSKREKSWDNLRQWSPERLKGDSAFRKYMEIYNAREQALTDGSLLPKEKSQGMRPSPN